MVEKSQQELIEEANSLLKKTKILLENVLDYQSKYIRKDVSDGFTKYKNAIKAEIKFLEKINSNPSAIKSSHVTCSNYSHLSAIFDLLSVEHNVQVFKAVHVKSELVKVVRIDVVADNGARWIKVKSGNLKTIESDLYDHEEEEFSESEDEELGELALPTPPLIKQAQSLILAASQNPNHFVTPKVVFKFIGVDSLPESLHQNLIDLGVSVEFGLSHRKPAGSPFEYHTDILNLDITTLLAMVSDMTHRFDKVPEIAYDSKPLKLQREDELVQPILPILKSILKDKTLVTSKTAFLKFQNIIETIGGPMEKQRAASIFSTNGLICELEILQPQPKLDIASSEQDGLEWKVFVVENRHSELFKDISGQKLKTHNIEIFNTGHALQLTTVTSNSWIKRALENSGKDTSIETHEPRCLIEQKWIKYTSQ
ncbi:hypothetical protein HDV06_001901 [Boothiomyces sp. JEL0866]|nr:hypothetical protein HDV06_001901 [Boothiomyces sp. JEL0866]